LKHITCNKCNNHTTPLNEAIKVSGIVYCIACAETEFTTEASLKGKTIERDIDPTICASCQGDYGSLVLDKIAAYPVCNDCKIKIKKRTFPLWVKAFFAAVLLLVVFSFSWNWRYYQGYQHINLSKAAVEKGDYATAARMIRFAEKKVPESEGVKLMSDYINGIDLLTREKSDSALALFTKCRNKLPPDYNIESMINAATAGDCFDKKDYGCFLTASIANLNIDSSAAAWASVASAYACIYAQSGQDSTRKTAYKYLEKAKSIDSLTDDSKLYYNLIEYRIYSRQIIRRQEFIEKFPGGWLKN
jgi:hypothetical protein